MPRISEATVAEHVARQEAAVFDAAIRLFTERGYAAVGLGDIAAEVGLARNSLYRYFPDKAHILVRWLQRELPRQAEHARAILSGDGPPVARIQRWAVDQLDYALRPEHRLVAALREAAAGLDDAARAELSDAHREVRAPLDAALRDAGVADADERSRLAALIGGLVLGAGERESRTGADPALRAHLERTLAALLR